MTVRFTLLASAALLALTSPMLAAPLKVGSGNEAVIEPAVPVPAETPCVVALSTDAKFGADPVNYSYTPPTACPGPWAKVVLDVKISLNQGRQFDRSGVLFLAGVPLWFGTTAEPRATLAPYWTVQKDVTDYTALFGSAQTGVFQIPNYQSDVYTSTITASASLRFYPVTAAAPAPVTADVVLPFPTGGGLATLNVPTDTAALTATLPTNILRATLDLYLQGQSGDEFWYLCVPNDVAGELESCSNTAFREGEIAIDGVPAGVAPVFPWIFTGGIDPYLWQPIPGVQTLNFTAFHADLTPFAGVLSNGTPHTVAASVYNANGYFSATGALLLFLDHSAATVSGSVTRNSLQPAAPVVTENLSTTDGVTTGGVLVKSKHDFTITGTVTGSAGTVVNTVTQTTDFVSNQHFKVSGTKDLQIAAQTTDTTIISTARGAGGTTSRSQSFHYPLSINYDFTTNGRGNSSQKTTVDQQFQQTDLLEVAGIPTQQSALTNAIQTADTLFFDASFNVTGHKSQSETAAYARTGTAAPCFKRKLVATSNVLTVVQTGC